MGCSILIPNSWYSLLNVEYVFANELLNIHGEDYLPNLIFEMAKKLGEDNLVFIRISDEDNGVDVEILPHLIYAETEYH